MQRVPVITVRLIPLLAALMMSPAAVMAQEGTPPDGPAQLQLGQVTLRDAAVGDIESHTLLVPQGWDLQGGPVWTPQTFRSFSHLDLRLTAPDGREVSVYPGMMYSYVQADAMPLLEPGGIDSGTILMPIPASIEEYVTEILLPQQRPGARDAHVVEVADRPEARQMLEDMFRPTVEAALGSDQMMGTQTGINLVATQVRVAYVEDGNSWEEDLYLEGTVQQTLSSDPYLGNMLQELWWIGDVSGVRAAAGSLDQAKPLLEPIRLSIRQTPGYAALISELNARLLRDEADALRKAREIWTDNQDEILRSHESSVAAQQESSDQAHHDFLNSIKEVEDYETPDGGTVSLPAFYDRVLTNGDGDYVLTNDALFEPADWTEIEVAP